jgi:FkbH-like protein
MKLVGHVDIAVAGSFAGWARDEDDPERKVEIELSGHNRSVVIVADHYRADLKELGFSDGRHGFKYVDPDLRGVRVLFVDTKEPIPSVPTIDEASYHVPRNLRLTPSVAKRVLITASCLMGYLPIIAEQSIEQTQCDFLLMGHGGYLPEPPRPPEEYDFQIVQVPLRNILHDSFLMRQEAWDHQGYRELLDEAGEVLRQTLSNALKWSDGAGIPAFVCNYMVPQQSAMGRLLGRYDLSNPVFFFEQLNRMLADAITEHPSARLLDVDGLAAIYGRRFVQDDATTIYTHGSIMTDYDAEHDAARLEPVTPLIQQMNGLPIEFLKHVWEEAVAAYRTIRQIDSVKLIVVDLDDTLWRGVVAEGAEIGWHHTEGWPIGFAEALMYLKKRGILLAILSRNDPERIRQVWPQLYGGRLLLEDFAATKISWNPKAEGMSELLRDLNLLPKNVLFIDDNPVERSAMLSAFPGIRTLGANPYELRRIMLWAPELQVATITAESARRTEMVQSQVIREAQKRAMPREEFLLSLNVSVDLYELSGIDDPRWARALELLNKTNQFNTTGKRWSAAELASALSWGLKVYAFDVQDKFTHYGLVGVILMRGTSFEQFVMSCRVLGLEAEVAVIADLMEESGGSATARLVETEHNLPCRDLWSRAGFSRVGDIFAADGAPEHPAHVTINFSPHMEITAAA